MTTFTPTSILEKLFKVDPGVARVLLIGLSVFAAIAIIGVWQIDQSRILPTFIWLVVAYIVFVFLANMPGWLSTLLGGLVCFGFAGYVGLFAVQLVGQNVFTPPMMAAGCFFSPAQQGCPLKVLPQNGRRAVAPASGDFDVFDEGEAVGPRDEAIVLQAPETPAAPATIPRNGTVARPASPEVVEEPSMDLADYRVFIQYFPRRLEEGAVTDLAQRLEDNGWRIASDLEGLSSAYGLNEVRYFFPEDEEAAERLANAVQRAAPWQAEMRVRDFTHVAGAEPGLLEIWAGG